MSSALQLEESIKDADLTIGAVLIPGASAPKLITREMLATMKESSVFVDVAIDQGGCAETSKPTTHDDPVYTVDGVIHYCVANMPGAVPITSTRALTNVTLPYVEQLADLGASDAVTANPELARGVNAIGGKLTYEAVCEAHGMEYTPLDAALGRRSELGRFALRPAEEATAGALLAAIRRGRVRVRGLLRVPLRREDLDDGVRDRRGEADDGRRCRRRAAAGRGRRPKPP